tara:strand:+ start:773 stop:943 length:171 start_codon:yes stop_codon:yes gene_type:complete
MANDHYINEDEQEQMMEEFYEWEVLNNMAALVETKGYHYVLSNIVTVVNNRESNRL